MCMCFTWYFLIPNYVARGPSILRYSRVVPLAGVINTNRQDPQQRKGSYNGASQLQDGQWWEQVTEMQGTEAASSLAWQGPQAVQQAEDIRAQAYGKKG